MKLSEIQLEVLDKINSNAKLKQNFDDYKFDDIYIWLNEEYETYYDDSTEDNYQYVGEFTKVLLDLGVDPLTSVKQIYDYMYYGCTLKHVEIPARIEEIGRGAFSDCSDLTSVTFAESGNLYSIDRCAFFACSSLTKLCIPKSVEYIGEMVFGYCDKLTKLEYAGTIEQFNDITLDDYWADESKLKVVHCTNGDLSAKAL